MGGEVFEHTSISRRHTLVTAAGGELVVEDLGSRNGTAVNGARCRGMRLTRHGVIGVGPILFVAHRASAEIPGTLHPRLSGRSHAILSVLEAIEKVAPYPTSVLVSGESGTGKEIVASEIHAASGRAGALRAINCGTLGGDLLNSEIFGHARGAFTGATQQRIGLLESAHQGTLFLDEIGEASADLQVSLLRFLDDGEVRPVGDTTSRKVDVRIIAASHRDLKVLIKRGVFREDLYARLSAWVIRLPPLRERIEDIPPLASHIVHSFTGRSEALHPRLMLSLLLHPWPRNVRELRAVLERAVIEAGGEVPIPLSHGVERLLTCSADDEDPGATSRASVKAPNRVVSKPPADQLIAMLTRQQGNIRRLSLELGVSRNTLYRWFREYSIESRRRGGSRP
jgi:DNA-binding NtrC family response regulator